MKNTVHFSLYFFFCVTIHRGCQENRIHILRKGGKKIAASSMLHEAKIAYYAFDVIRLFVPYRVAARTCCAVNVLTSRIYFLFS